MVKLPKIEARPWKPQDLLDDLQEIINEEPDSYMNTRRTTLCMALDYLKEHFSVSPNTPLTLEELREMDGEPVWVVTSADRAQWAFVVIDHEEFISFNCADGTEWEFDLYGDNDGVSWTAFRSKPEDGMI